MFRPFILILAASFSAAACGHDAPPKSPKFSEVLPSVPLPPNPTFVSKSGGEDALQITVRSPAGADAVADYYRHLFKSGGWKLVNEARGQGAVVLFAEQNGKPLWVRVRSADDGSGTLVDLAGARLTEKKDSARTAATAGPKPTS